MILLRMLNAFTVGAQSFIEYLRLTSSQTKEGCYIISWDRFNVTKAVVLVAVGRDAWEIVDIIQELKDNKVISIVGGINA